MKKIQSLSGRWNWRQMGSNNIYEGLVPGSVLADMLRLGLVEDPFWRTNEIAAKNALDADFVYSTVFAVEQEDLQKNMACLVFDGLDTIADILLNGKLLASVKNMHRSYCFDVKNILQVGNNTLEIKFYSASSYIRSQAEKSDIFYASTGCMLGNASLRKAHYMFGWDWGPQLPDAGIFRPVYIEYADTAVIEDVEFEQKHGEIVELVIVANIKKYALDTLFLQAEIVSPSGKIIATKKLQLLQDNNMQVYVSVELLIEHPSLWWPNGMGEQPLYTVILRLSQEGVLLDESKRRIGLRTVTVSTAEDKWGSEFAFVVNGHKMFAMGANYIPEDNIISRVSPKQTANLVQDCAKANFNMLRVWGGGYYPDDCFYDECDENGILIWQDLMFACNVYALDNEGEFELNITKETSGIVRRLRHHASLALWCGNNEMEWGWGDEWARIKGHHPRYKADYIKIFEFILERVVKENDPYTFWWPSSPSSGGAFFKPNDSEYGDQHYWEVWHSGKPFTEYRNSYFRFCSEYGFQSFPHIKSISSFTLPQDRNMFSEVMESHQKNGAANGKIFSYVADYFLYPKDLGAISYISQVLQLKAIQYGVEHWRQNRGRCMGSLYWQLNDCWPVASWASIDYYGRWKALHYGAKRFYAPFCASAREDYELSPKINYYVHNDTLVQKDYLLEVCLMDTAFNKLAEFETSGSVAPLSAVSVLKCDFSDYIVTHEYKKSCFALYRLIANSKIISQDVTLFIKPKHFNLPRNPVKAEVIGKNGKFEIVLKSDAFSYYTEIYFTGCDPVLSDNYFHITSAEKLSIAIDGEKLPKAITLQELQSQLVVRSVRDSYTTETEGAL